MSDHTFSRFAYFDTNIISIVAQEGDLWEPIRQDFVDRNLTLAFGPGHAAELTDASHLYDRLVAFLVSVPSAVIKNPDDLVAEEVISFPQGRVESLLSFPLNALLLEAGGIEKFRTFLSSDSLANARADQKKHSRQMPTRHAKLKRNFPPARSGKYETHQADEFANLMTVQWLAGEHPQFIRAHAQSDLSSFRSIRLYALVNFYKYYLGKRRPTRLSDFGDLLHLFSLPYCEVAVFERDLAEILGQIKRNHAILERTQIANLDYLHEYRNTASSNA